MWNKPGVWNDHPFAAHWTRWCFHSGAATQQRKQATSDFGQQGDLTGKSQGTLSQFEGPVQQSPFYKAMLNTGIESTSNAYQRARANQTQRAQQAGFGNAQPVTQGANSQMDAAEAESLSQVPERALEATAPLSLEAANQTGNMGMGYGAQGTSLLNANAGKGPFWRQLYLAGANNAGQAAGAAAAA